MYEWVDIYACKKANEKVSNWLIIVLGIFMDVRVLFELKWLLSNKILMVMLIPRPAIFILKTFDIY